MFLGFYSWNGFSIMIILNKFLYWSILNLKKVYLSFFKLTWVRVFYFFSQVFVLLHISLVVWIGVYDSPNWVWFKFIKVCILKNFCIVRFSCQWKFHNLQVADQCKKRTSIQVLILEFLTAPAKNMTSLKHEVNHSTLKKV